MRETPRIPGTELYRGALSLITLGIAVYTGGETARIAPFAFGALLLICLELLLLPGTRYVNLPFLQLSLLFIFCYDSFDTFIKFVWILPLVLIALGVHLWRLRPRLRFGPTLLPLMLVALATMLGGVGMISAEEYFRPVVLGYVLGLGPGLVLTYLLMKNELCDREDRKAWLSDLFWWGLTAAAAVFAYALPPLLQGDALPFMQWSNNASTMLMIAMPAVAARVRRYPVLFPLLIAIPAAMILTGSRAGLLFAPVELLICIVWLICSTRGRRRRIFHGAWALALMMAGCTADTGNDRNPAGSFPPRHGGGRTLEADSALARKLPRKSAVRLRPWLSGQCRSLQRQNGHHQLVSRIPGAGTGRAGHFRHAGLGLPAGHTGFSGHTGAKKPHLLVDALLSWPALDVHGQSR